MAGKTMTARAATVALLGMILDEGAMLSQAMAEDGVMDTLPPQERARAQRLTLSVLRHLEQTDRILAPHLRKKTPPMVLNTLRLAVVEMVVEGAAAHGVVNEAVSLMRSDKRSVPMAGLVNAVLRKVSNGGVALLEGLDAIDLTLKSRPAIDAWTDHDRAARPWVYLEKLA